MKLSTKGRYGLRALIDLALYSENEAVSIQSIADRQSISYSYLEQLVDSEQLAALSYLLVYASKHLMDGRRTLTDIVLELERRMDSQGLASLSDSSYLASDLCRPRRQEIFACFDRCRELQFN